MDSAIFTSNDIVIYLLGGMFLGSEAMQDVKNRRIMMWTTEHSSSKKEELFNIQKVILSH